MKTAPCIECEHRHMGCHADCIVYKDWRKEHEAVRQTIYKAKQRESSYINYENDTARRLQKYRKEMKK